MAVLAFLPYVNALTAGFVWDDLLMVLENPWLSDPGNLPLMFVRSEVGYRPEIVANYYRPLKNVAYLLTYQVAGFAPWAYHLANVALHVVASVLVLLLARRFVAGAAVEGSRRTEAGAFTAAAIFAVHPIHTEAVTWIAALPEVGYTAFGLASLLALDRWRESDRARWLVASLAAFGVALLWKEPAVAWLPVLAAWDWTVGRRRGWRAFAWVVPFAALLAAYVALRSHALGGFVPTRGLQSLSALEILLTAATLFAEYVRYLLAPWPLAAYHALVPATSLDARVAIAVPVVLAFVAAALVALRRRDPLLVAAVAFAVPLLPILYVPAVGENAFAERYLYMPSFGFALAIAWAVPRALARRPDLGRRLVAAAAILVALGAAATLARNRVWADDRTLWSDSARKAPDGFVPQAAMGDMLSARGHFAEAIPYWQAALRVAETSAAFSDAERRDRVRTMHNNLGAGLTEVRAWAEAARHLEAALALDPSSPEIHNNLGRLAMGVGDPLRAVGHYRTALANVEQPPAGLLRNLAQAYRAAGMHAEAAAAARAAAALPP